MTDKTPMLLPLKDYLDPVISIAEKAADAILEVYNTDFGVREKDDNTPLTKADLAAHRTIVSALHELTPDVPVLSEESAELPYEVRRQWDTYWLVDPLDGTREFIKRNGEFTVNIALIHDGRSRLGVVQVPVRNEVYFAAEGLGAHHQAADGERKQLAVRDAPSPLVVAGSRSHPGDRLKGYLDALGDHELISMGSSLKFCLVASGRADVYVRLGLTSEWDTAAAQCVVEEAGGSVTDTDMKPLRYNTRDSLLNPEFFVFGDDSIDWSAYLDL